jgi:competence protein ComEC
MKDEHTPISAVSVIPRETLASCVLLCVLGLLCVGVWSHVFALEQSGVLRVSYLDVGQGDSILIESPRGARILIDGGKNARVLQELGAEIPFGSRTIDVVLATHPDLDHIGGLPHVFERYEVGLLLEPCVSDEGADYSALLDAVQAEGSMHICAREGMRVQVDEEVVLEVLFPDREVSGMEANSASLVTRLTYGDTAFLFMGDSPVAIEEYLAGRFADALQSDVLKLGHHGSKTSTSDTLLGYADPRYAVVSAGCGNSYGHPHREVLERLEAFDVSVVQTCEEGTVRFLSDGTLVRRI